MKILLSLIVLLMADPGSARVNRLPPVDRCASDRSFVEFRQKLRAAIARRDVAFIRSVTSDDMAGGFGDESGREPFLSRWGLREAPAKSGFWAELSAVLKLGCDRDPRGILWSPSFSMPDDDDPDDASYEGNMLALPGAKLRSSPSSSGRILANLRWDIVRLDQDDDRQSPWAEVEMANGRKGYVRRSELRSFIDYRAIFEKRDGRWLMIGFVEGD